MSNLLGYLCSFVHEAVATFNALRNREVGWVTVDRKTGEFKREKQPLLKKLKLLLLFSPVTEWIDRTQLLRLWTHEKNIYAGTPYAMASYS